MKLHELKASAGARKAVTRKGRGGWFRQRQDRWLRHKGQ